MSLSKRQRELQRQAAAAQREWEEEVDRRGPRLFSRLLILAFFAAGAYGGWLYSDWAMGSEERIAMGLAFSFTAALALSIFGGLLAAAMGSSAHAVAQRSARATGIIVGHRVTGRTISDSGTQGQSLILEVDFEVGEEPFMATVQPSATYSNVPGHIERLKKRYPKGDTIDIAYDPEDPTDHDVPRSKLLRRLAFHATKFAFYLGMGAAGFFAGFLVVMLSEWIPALL